MAASFSKTRQRWNYNICFTGGRFSARADARRKTAPELRSVEPESEFGSHSGRAQVRRDHWPLRSRWPVRAFISETWEQVEDGGPGVRYADKLPPIRPPSSLPPHLHLIPSLSSSFVCLFPLPPLSFRSQSISPDRMEWYELNKPQELFSFSSFLKHFSPLTLPSSGLLAISPFSLSFSLSNLIGAAKFFFFL